MTHLACIQQLQNNWFFTPAKVQWLHDNCSRAFRTYIHIDVCTYLQPQSYFFLNVTFRIAYFLKRSSRLGIICRDRNVRRKRPFVISRALIFVIACAFQRSISSQPCDRKFLLLYRFVQRFFVGSKPRRNNRTTAPSQK